MKKLVSIKTDETGEILYFTHKKGVDAIRKSDVVDVELEEPKYFWQKRYGGLKYNIIYSMSSYLIVINTCILFIRDFDWSFNNFSFNIAFPLFVGLLFYVQWLACFVIIIPIILGFFFDRCVYRDVIIIYTPQNVYLFRAIKSDDIQNDLFLHFKKYISKYLPKKGDSLLVYCDKGEKSYLKFLLILSITVLILSLSFLMINIFQETGNSLIFPIANLTWGLIFGVLISGLLVHYRYNFINVVFESDKLICRYKFFREDEAVINVNLREIELGGNSKNWKVSINLKEEINSDHSKLTTLLRGEDADMFQKLKFTEEFVDLTPLMIAYINDLSEQQRTVEQSSNPS